MNLSSTQILNLIIPIVVAVVVYLFNDSIVQNAKYLFPTYQEYTNKMLDKKADIYLKIESKDKIYQEIRENRTLRKENAKWMAQNVLYKKQKKEYTPVSFTNKEEQAQKETKKIYKWELQAIFPKKKIAIINNNIVKVGSKIDNAVVKDIKNDKVLIKYDEGLKWLYMFH